MRELSAGFPTRALVESLESGWGFRLRELVYLPVGFGAHHWRASRGDGDDVFVSVHELDLVGRSRESRGDNFEVLRRALGTARWLASVAQLDFVLAPLADLRGEAVYRLEDAYAVHVYPWMDCEILYDPDGVITAELIARLHGQHDRIPVDLVRQEDFELPHRAALEGAVDNLDVSWDTGPYAEPARKQLREHEWMVRALIAYYDGLTELAGTDRRDWVITHGEPRGANLVRTTAGEVRMIDWDTVLVAPRERDLWELPLGGVAQQTYQTLVQRGIDARWLRLFEAWYALAELAVYLAVFRSPHTADENVILSWVNFLDFLPTRERWPELSRDCSGYPL